MKIVVSSQGEGLDAAASPVFGRCPTYVFVDTETMEFEAMANPAMSQGGGAGIQAAQFAVNQGAEAVLTGHLGPNAFDVLQAANVPGYLVPEGTVRQAVDAFKAGQLEPMGGANVAAHAGMSGGGRGMGTGRGARVVPAPSKPDTAREAELSELGETLKGLRRQLAETLERIECLERETKEREEN
ncbi:NifB/NifX family molybdenum-iron cluster-binding protein [Chloroflexota bacterium]